MRREKHPWTCFHVLIGKYAERLTILYAEVEMNLQSETQNSLIQDVKTCNIHSTVSAKTHNFLEVRQKRQNQLEEHHLSVAESWGS